MPATEPETRGARLHARAEALATRRNAAIALGLLALGVLAVFLLRPTYPNYDSYYTLIWGDQLASGHVPDYDVFRSPTPHPLATLVGAVVSLMGVVGDRVLVLLVLASFAALVALLFRFTQMLLGTLVAAVAVLVLLTRVDLEFFALRAMVDVPFLALVFGAAVLELRRPRRGTPVLALLALAGLLRPEAWLLSGAYFLWLAPGSTRGQLLRFAALAASAPLLWTLSDLLVTGHPLYSITSTREVAGEFKRQRSLLGAVKLVPDYVGGNEKIVNVVAGGLGALLALALVRARAALPLALMGLGLMTFLAIAAAGLSVIPRYLLIPSLLFNLAVAVALAGWTLARERRLRRAAAAVALLALALVVFRTPAYLKDARKLREQTVFVRDQHRGLKGLLSDPSVVPLLRSCGPVTVPTHSAIPVVRWETGLPARDIEPSIAQARPPESGLLLIGTTANFEPAAARTIAGGSQKSALKWWSNYPLSTFRRVAGNDRWEAYARCA